MTTVLLIESNAESASSYTAALQRAGFRVRTEGEELAPDMVVIGVSRVGPSIDQLIANGRIVPRIVISSDPSDRHLAASLGCAILIRPVMYDDLVREVRLVLKRAASEQPSA